MVAGLIQTAIYADFGYIVSTATHRSQPSELTDQSQYVTKYVYHPATPGHVSGGVSLADAFTTIRVLRGQKFELPA